MHLKHSIYQQLAAFQQWIVNKVNLSDSCNMNKVAVNGNTQFSILWPQLELEIYLTVSVAVLSLCRGHIRNIPGIRVWSIYAFLSHYFFLCIQTCIGPSINSSIKPCYCRNCSFAKSVQHKTDNHHFCQHIFPLILT